MRSWKILVFALAVIGGATGVSRAESSAERRMRALEETVRKATEEMQQLRKELDQQKAIGAATQKQAEVAEEKAKTVEKAQAGGVDLPSWLKKVTLFGDVRLRHEGFYNQQHANGDLIGARNRERVRARLGAKITYSDELSATIRLATGDPDDPISTNESLTGSFNRKHINLDQAYITFTPGKSFGFRPGVFSISGGKLPSPVFKVGEMVFDDDLMGEGLSETFALLGQPMGALDQVKIHMLQWTFSEIANSQDGWIIGGQLNPQAHVGDWLIEGGLAQYWWLNADQIAVALGTNKSLKNSNILEIEKSDGTIRRETNQFAKPGTGEKIVGYAGAFNQTNVSLAVTHPTLLHGIPLKLFADYVYNWHAFTNYAHGVQAGLKIGQTKVKGDWAITGLYEYLGQEAALSSFTYSDFGFGLTNVQGPVLGVEYQLLDPLTISARNHFTNLINRPENYRNPTMFRLQLDALFRF